MRTVAVASLALLLFVAGCKDVSLTTATSPTTMSTVTATPSVTPSQTRTTSPAALSEAALKYRLIDYYGPVFFCDPDYYPVARTGQEQQNALDQFPAIRANTAEFTAIVGRLGLPDRSDYAAEEKLSVYREHKKLVLGLDVAPSGNSFTFTLRVGQNQGYRIGGTITAFGVITETSRETSFNTCPICLSKGTPIATPSGAVPVERITQGMVIWTADGSGRRVEGSVVAVSSTPVPVGFQMVRLTLGDGRSITASPGHPSAEGRALGEYEVGDALDGAVVSSAEAIPYGVGVTYDLLPSGPTGLYWADGILLRSTLAGQVRGLDHP